VKVVFVFVRHFIANKPMGLILPSLYSTEGPALSSIVMK
jgi:hypothetical protein